MTDVSSQNMPAEQPIPINDLLALQVALSRYKSVSDAVPNLQGDVKKTLNKVFKQHGNYTHMGNLLAAIDGKITAAQHYNSNPK